MVRLPLLATVLAVSIALGALASGTASASPEASPFGDRPADVDLSNTYSLPSVFVETMQTTQEKNAVKEAQDMNIPVIALLGSDCNMKDVDYPIVGNDASVASIKFFVNEITKAYSEAKKA